MSAKKRSEERKGHRSKAELAVTKGVARPVTVPPAAKHWCTAARRAYKAYGSSGHSDFAQDSDWAMAWLMANTYDQVVKMDSRPSAMLIAEVRQMMQALAYTERDRRAMNVELEELSAPEVDKGAAGVSDAKNRLKRKVV